MKPNYYIVFGIIICLYLLFSGYMSCSTFQSRDCNVLGLDYDCRDGGHGSYPSRGSYRHDSGSGSGSSGNNWGRWFHK